jgi:hypothetical protein
MKEGSDEKFSSDWGQLSEVRVRTSSSSSAETEPSPPGSVVRLVAFLDSAVKCDAAIRSGDKTQEQISLGSGDVLKFGSDEQ